MILLDAPVFLRWVGAREDLGPERCGLLERTLEPLALCHSALIELAESHREGKWSCDQPFQAWLESALASSVYVMLPQTPAIVSRASRFSVGDVWDRLFLATAVEHDLEIATLDPVLRMSPGVRQLF